MKLQFRTITVICETAFCDEIAKKMTYQANHEENELQGLNVGLGVSEFFVPVHFDDLILTVLYGDVIKFQNPKLKSHESFILIRHPGRDVNLYLFTIFCFIDYFIGATFSTREELNQFKTAVNSFIRLLNTP